MLSGNANQLTEMVPPSRSFGAISAFAAKNATKAFILNISDMLMYIMGTTANLQAAYDPAAHFCNASIGTQCQDLQRQWITQWAQKLFGVDEAAAQQVAEAYAAYFTGRQR
jgi:hypothetical protein